MVDFFSLEISEKYIKILDSDIVNNKVKINSIGKIEINNDFFNSILEKEIYNQASLINQLFNQLKITKKNVNIIIPDSVTYNQVVKMPYLNEKELISAIKYQADQFIPIPIDNANIDIEIIEENKEKKEIELLIVAAEKKIIEKVQTVIELAGLIPESIETEVSTYARLIEKFNNRIISSLSGSFLLINFSLNNSILYLFDNLTYLLKQTHNIPLGYLLFLKEVKINTDNDEIKSSEILKNFNINEPSSLPIKKIINPILKEYILELKKFINLKNIKTIFLTNQISFFPSLVKILEEEIQIPIKTIEPSAFIENIESYNNIIGELNLYLSLIGGNIK